MNDEYRRQSSFHPGDPRATDSQRIAPAAQAHTMMAVLSRSPLPCLSPSAGPPPFDSLRTPRAPGESIELNYRLLLQRHPFPWWTSRRRGGARVRRGVRVRVIVWVSVVRRDGRIATINDKL